MNNIKYIHNLNENGKLKVCAYGRISSIKEHQETSLNEQIEYYSGLILNEPAFDFVGIYADEGKSGTTLKGRKQFNLMVSKAIDGEIDLIITKSISRFARNAVDFLSVIRKLRIIGCEVFFEEQNLSTLDPKADLLLSVFSSIAEEESKSISENVKWSQKKKNLSGKYVLNTWQLLGYETNASKEIIINKKEAFFIQEIYKKYINGETISDIGKYLENNKCKTPYGKNKWNDTSIRNILKNEKYCGDAILQKTFTPNYMDHKKIRNTGEKTKYYIRDGHPAIIDRDTFNQAQAIRKKRIELFKVKTLESGYQKTANSLSQFSSFAYCPYCGSNYFIKTNHYHDKKTKMLYCASNKNTRNCLESESLYIDYLEEILLKQINIILANKSKFENALLTGFSNEEGTIMVKSELKTTQAKIKALNAKMCRMKDKESDFYSNVKNELNIEAKELSLKKANLENTLLTTNNPQNKTKRIMKEINKIYSLKSLDGFNFRNIFSKVIVVKRDKLIFVIGDADYSKISTNSLLQFTGTYTYKIRKTKCTTEFGIIIK